ncbi:MAG: type I 3-dehydroquinate dehydratase [Lachnospiraceae bacterium]|nr:type I 3-dehydroquinate dehydratase [Lachnospiraceae bacterium]
MSSVKIGNITLEKGAPKICVSLTSKGEGSVVKEAAEVSKLPCDIAEWRYDMLEAYQLISELDETGTAIREALNGKPLIFTFRTKREGGEKAVTPEQYKAMLLNVVETGIADAIDVELFCGDEIFKEVCAFAHRYGTVVIGSNHDFEKTPSKEEMISRLKKMFELGADVAKLAVMPQSPEDVLTLMSATEEITRDENMGPVITMAMSDLGTVSRVAGALTGSAMTFASAEKESAPGQLPVQICKDVIGYLGINEE